MSAEAPQQTPPAAPSDQGISDANDGFITGVDPKQPVDPTLFQQGNAAESVSQPVQVVDTPPSNNGAMFTAEDLEKVRREEKDKLYGRLSTMEEQLQAVVAEKEEREAAERAAIEEAEAKRKAEEEEKMELRELLEKREQELRQEMNAQREQYERDKALFEKEREFAALQQFRAELLQKHAADIIPELRDLVGGNSEEELLQSIEEMKSRSAVILENVGAVAAQNRQLQQGVSSATPSVGPMENESGQQTLSPQDIADMDIQTFAKYRDTLLPAASQAFRRGG